MGFHDERALIATVELAAMLKSKSKQNFLVSSTWTYIPPDILPIGLRAGIQLHVGLMSSMWLIY
jgi:hypothetical protein